MFSISNAAPQTLQTQPGLSTQKISEGHALAQGLPVPNAAYNDPILKVYEQLETGMTAKYLENSWKQPSVTWLGKFFDKHIWKAGEYSKQELTESEKRSNSNLVSLDFRLEKDGEQFYPEDFDPSTWDQVKEGALRIYSFISRSLKVDYFLTGNKASTQAHSSTRKSYCPTIDPNEVICLPLAVSEEKGERPLCLPKNPRTIYVHIIAREQMDERILDLYNAAFARYRNFCAKNCLTCDSVSDLGVNPDIWEKTHKMPDIASFHKNFNFTVISPQGNITTWDKFQILHFSQMMISRGEVYTDTQIKNEKILKGIGCSIIVLSVAGIGIMVFKNLIDMQLNQDKKQPKQSDTENELKQVSST